MGIIRIRCLREAATSLVEQSDAQGRIKPAPPEKLLRAIFVMKARDNAHFNSLRVRHERGQWWMCASTPASRAMMSCRRGQHGGAGVAAKRGQVGDKMAGRHGNRASSAHSSPRACPTCQRWHPSRHRAQPLGMPSRMNVGQVFECLMGWASSHLDCRVKVVPFDEMRR